MRIVFYIKHNYSTVYRTVVCSQERCRHDYQPQWTSTLINSKLERRWHWMASTVHIVQYSVQRPVLYGAYCTGYVAIQQSSIKNDCTSATITVDERFIDPGSLELGIRPNELFQRVECEVQCSTVRTGSEWYTENSASNNFKEQRTIRDYTHKLNLFFNKKHFGGFSRSGPRIRSICSP